MVIFFAALMGLVAGGPRGLLIGIVVGFVLQWALRRQVGGRVRDIQAEFLDSTFAVMGALCKADGVVTPREIAVAETLFARLNLSAAQREAAMTAFNRGKAPDFDLAAKVARFAQVSRGQRVLLTMFLQIQCAAIAADGNVHAAEHAMLVRVARMLGLTEHDVAQLEALLRTGTGSTQGGAGPGAPTPQQKLADAYEALGVRSEASDAEIKQAYRRQMSQNHPDKMASKGLPESMRAMAEERTRELSTAYALIKEARGFS